MRKLIVLVIILIAANACLFYLNCENDDSFDLLNIDNANQQPVNLNHPNVNKQAEFLKEETVQPQGEVAEEPKEPEEIAEIKDEVYLDVPFSSQAPDANWGQPYQDACEEISVIMVDAFWRGEKLTKESADQKIWDLVNFQNENYGDYISTSAEETARFIKEYYGYKKVEVKYNITLNDIKRELSAGRPVIVPAYGRGLGNPNYTAPGPVYHMLVVIGYETQGIINRGEKIITNDGGTRKGEDFAYDPEVFMDAIHDWNEGDVQNGRKVMIVVYP